MFVWKTATGTQPWWLVAQQQCDVSAYAEFITHDTGSTGAVAR